MHNKVNIALHLVVSRAKDQCEHKTILCDLGAVLCVCGKRELLLQVKCIPASVCEQVNCVF